MSNQRYTPEFKDEAARGKCQSPDVLERRFEPRNECVIHAHEVKRSTAILVFEILAEIDEVALTGSLRVHVPPHRQIPASCV